MIDTPSEAETANETNAPSQEVPNLPNGREEQDIGPASEPVQDENLTTETQPESKMVSRTNERYALRPRPKKTVPYSYYVATLLACIHFLAVGGAATVTSPSPRASTQLSPCSMATISYRYLGAKCTFQPGEKYPVIGRNTCVETGYAIYNVSGRQCYRKFSYPNKHLQPVGHPLCGPKCKCPLWAMDCTHYNGSVAVAESTYSNPLARKVLDALKPPICSHKWTHECSWADYRTEFEVELYDSSRHFVSSLTLAHEQYDSNDVVCSEGSAKTTMITGTDQFCLARKCSSSASNFCWMPTSGKVSLTGPLGRIPIRSWAASHILAYRHNETAAMLNESATVIIDIGCQPYGVSVEANAPLELVQTCAQKYCVRKFGNVSEPTLLSQKVKLPI